MKPSTELWATRLLCVALIALVLLGAYHIHKANKTAELWYNQWEIKQP